MKDYSPSSKYYNENVAEISQQYLSVSFENVHVHVSLETGGRFRAKHVFITRC
jgi:hypothetical protein